MSRFFTVSRRTFSLTKSTRCRIILKNNVLCRYSRSIARVVRAHVPPSGLCSYIFFCSSNSLRMFHLELTVNLRLDAPGGPTSIQCGEAITRRRNRRGGRAAHHEEL